MKPISISNFAGLRNDVSPERFKPEDLSKATNIELDETGKPYRRLGTTVLDATPVHSLWADGDICLCVRGGTLTRVLPDLTFATLGVTVAGPRVVYKRIFNDVFWTDGLVTGIVTSEGTTKNLTPSAGAAGAMNGVEEHSAALSRYNALTGSNGGSKLPMLAAYASALPAGQLLGYYNGRLYVADNNYLWYTQPHDYHTVNRVSNYIGFTAPVKTFAPVSDGIFVGSETETVFLAGKDPSEFRMTPVAPYGTVLGTEVEISGTYFMTESELDRVPDSVQLWMSKQGLCAGLDGGQLMNLTGERYRLPDGVATGASLLKLRGESPQLVTTLFQ